MTPEQQAIVRAATEEGIDPATALAYAARESNFNPRARSSKTIKGMFQMMGPLREQYGVGESDDPYVQAKGWSPFFKRTKAEMAYKLGRPVSDEETYLGHHFGAGRAARMLKMDPSTPVDQVFTPNEMAQNPHFGRAGTVGALNGSLLADMSGRRQKFGGSVPDLSGEGIPVGADNGPATPPATAAATSAPDLSSFGILAEPSNKPAPEASSAPDFSKYGTPAENPMMIKGPVQTMGIRG